MLTAPASVAKEVVAERFGPEKKVQKDMLGSFIAHGLTQEEAGSETLLQMSVLPYHRCPLPPLPSRTSV